MTESKPPAAPDGEGPYRVEQTIAGEWAIVGPTIEGERTADEETTRLDCAELNAAFTAGQQHRSDGGEVAAAESHDYPLISAEALARRFHETYERRAPDFGYKTREESAVPWPDVPPDNRALMIAVAAEILDALTPAPRREGEPRRWVARHTDQHVVRPEPFELGMNFVVQSREAADRLAEILNAQPAPPVLVDAARKLPAMFKALTADLSLDPDEYKAAVCTNAAQIADEISAAEQLEKLTIRAATSPPQED